MLGVHDGFVVDWCIWNSWQRLIRVVEIAELMQVPIYSVDGVLLKFVTETNSCSNVLVRKFPVYVVGVR